MGSLTLKLHELSGLTKHPSLPEMTYLAIGDRSYEIAQFTIPSDPSKALSFDLAKKVPGAAAQRSSQWEAIQADSNGTIVLLVEDPARILIVSLKDKDVTGSYDLVVNEEHPLAKSWKEQASSRGEGLLLLEDGFILVAKEKNPRALMLFGPMGSALPSKVQLLKSPSWKTPAQEMKSLELLYSWEPSEKAALQLADVSDLAADINAGIFLLSDESRRICEIRLPLLTTAAHFDTNSCFVFPGKLPHPEGLSIQGTSFVVGLDNMAKKTNVHAFTRRPITP